MKQQQQSLKQAAIIIQKWYRAYRSRKSTKILAKKLYQRRKIIQQLVVTQQKYIHDLGIIVSDFQMHLYNQKIINKQDTYALFCNVDAIRKLNEHFFTILYNNFVVYWHYKIIFQDVKKETYFFKIYFQYLNNFTNSMAKMKQLKQKTKDFPQFLNRIKKNPKYGNLDFQDYIIKPVQRLPKYVLLLKLLVKKTPIDHPDYQNIKIILTAFQDVNCSNNDKLNKIVNNFKLSELQKSVNLHFHITQPGTQFILQENVSILNPLNKIQDSIMYLLNNRMILTKKNKTQQKFLQTIDFRQGASLMENQDQQLYSNCFTVQSMDGDSITFSCQGQSQKLELMEKIQQQMTKIEKNAYDKLYALQNSHIPEQFLKRISRFDLMPEITVLGTQQRTDKMLKYTTYIIEVKIKNVRQKIFFRYSQLLSIQSFIKIQFPKLEIKNSLFKTTWLLNHKPRTIQQRKMSIQKFLKQILSKPQIIQSGHKILSKLGLPEDLYFLPQKIKDSQTFIKKSSITNVKSSRGQKQKSNYPRSSTLNSDKTRKTYRLSIFQELQEQDEKPFRKYSLKDNNVKASTNKKKLNIQQILHANQINLGHYTRFSQNIQCIAKKKIKIQIVLPWIQNSKGYAVKTIQIFQSQRVAVLINKLAKQIHLNYYKDFRLFLQKQYSQRVLDDDEIILKVQSQLITGRYRLIFKKMIYIDRESQQNEIRNDRLRLKLIASQIIYEVKKAKYKLDYNKFLILSVLIGIIQHQNSISISDNKNNYNLQKQNKKLPIKMTKSKSYSTSTITLNEQTRLTFKKQTIQIQPNYKDLALKSRQILANPYSSFFQNDKVWIKDFTDTYKNLCIKLKKIAKGNLMMMKSNSFYTQQQQMIWTSLVQLSYISIVDQIKHNQLFGSMAYVVQISQEFRQTLLNNLQLKNDQSQIPQLDLQTKQNRNVWLIVKCDQVMLYSINLSHKLYSIKFDVIDKILCYPSSIILCFNVKKSQVQSLKLKTTSSFIIRQILSYYKNYQQLSKKIAQDYQYTDSLIQMIQQNQRMIFNQSQKSQSVLITY